MRYWTRRALALLITLMLVSVIAFLAFNLIPGDPATIMLGTEASPQKIEALREQLGLNDPLGTRYIHWIASLARGDLGQSIRFSLPVKDLLMSRIPVTLWLTALSILMIAVLGIPLGVYSAKKEGGPMDAVINGLGQISMSMPSFFLGMLLMLVFGILLKWFAPGNYIDYHQNYGGFLKYLLLPALSIALPKSAVVVKFLRVAVIGQMNLDYVRTAYSKGTKENTVLYRHVLKNAVIPVITLMGMIIADIIAGSIIIEQLFAVPGIGSLLIVGIAARDFPLVQTIVMMMAFMTVMINFLVDLLYRAIDPRIRPT